MDTLSDTQPDAQTENNGDTPLHTAVRMGDVKMVALLLGRCNPWMMNHHHETALIVAKQQDNAAVIRLLEPSSTSTRGGDDSKTKSSAESGPGSANEMAGSAANAEVDDIYSFWKWFIDRIIVYIP